MTFAQDPLCCKAQELTEKTGPPLPCGRQHDEIGPTVAAGIPLLLH